MAVLPENINDNCTPKQIEDYIKYMRERIEFAASEQAKINEELRSSLTALNNGG